MAEESSAYVGDLKIIGGKIICDTFNILYNELCPYVQKESTNMRSSVTVEEGVAVIMWKLATKLIQSTIHWYHFLARADELLA